MKYNKGVRVRVGNPTDETMLKEYHNFEGVVVGHNENGETGNTPDDPLHIVHFWGILPPGMAQEEQFWYEELTEI